MPYRPARSSATLAAALALLPALGEAQTLDTSDGGATVSRALRPPGYEGPPASSATGRLPGPAREAIERSKMHAPGEAPPGLPGYADSSPDGRKVVRGRSRIPPSPPAFGTSEAPYTTARVAVTRRGDSESRREDPVTSYPYRATGKLHIRFASRWFICTGALVGRSVLVTAAHCVFHYGEGSAGWADEVWFAPANYSDDIGAAYGNFSGKTLRIPKPYFDGTDTCSPVGVICNNDIATIILNPLRGKGAGEKVGWYAYAWNGYGFERSEFLEDAVAGQITQLGYPGAFDNGLQMQRTDAVSIYGKVEDLQGMQMGSPQSNGSSGGPWFVNFGTVPNVDARASLGEDADMAIVGVTSWGAVAVDINLQGASYFGQTQEFPRESYGGYGAGNIGKLMRDTCTSDAAAS
jgi:V8-like Glu-specific endopeptidase